MATKKVNPSNKKSAAPKAAPTPSILVGCCSAALDLIFVNDPLYQVQVGTTAEIVTSVRISHPNKKFQILGLLEAGVNKGKTPWQIYVVPGNNPSALTALSVPPSKPRKKKK